MKIKKDNDVRFNSLNNIKTAFEHIRILAVVFFILCVVVVSYTVYSSYNFAEKQREKIYVLDKGKSLMLALSQDAKINRPAEAKEHATRFHEYMFTLSPDNKGIEYNVNKAIVMGDKSISNFYRSLSEKNFYKDIMANDVMYRVEIDSVNINFNYYPYQTTTYAKQYVKRRSNTTTRNLITECFLEEIGKSDNNPQGFYITRFRVLDNSDINIENNTNQ